MGLLLTQISLFLFLFDGVLVTVSADRTLPPTSPGMNTPTIHITINYTSPTGNMKSDSKELRAEDSLITSYKSLIGIKYNGKLIVIKKNICRKINTTYTGDWIALIPPQKGCDVQKKLQTIFKGTNAIGIIFVGKDSESISDVRKSVDRRIAIWMSQSLLPPLDMLANSTTSTVFIEVASYGPENFINRTSVLFVSISFILLMIISLAWLVFYYIQRFRYIHAKERLSRRLVNAAKKALGKIPIKVFRSGDPEVDNENEQCAVCIEPYFASDAVRILPCKHFFHKSCIDPWLLEQRSCPMCKVDILKACGVHVNTGGGGGLSDAGNGGGDNPLLGDHIDGGGAGISGGAVGGVVSVPLSTSDETAAWTSTGGGLGGGAFLELRRTSLPLGDVGQQERISHPGRFGAVYEVSHVVPAPDDNISSSDVSRHSHRCSSGLAASKRCRRCPDMLNGAEEGAMSSSEEWTRETDPLTGLESCPDACTEVVEARLERRPSFSHSTGSSVCAEGGAN